MSDAATGQTGEPLRYTTRQVGELERDGRTYRLAHIDPVRRDETCTRSGRTYLCGFYAFQSWERLVASRAIACTPEGPDGHVRCRDEDGEDLAMWLLRGGYARVSDPQAPQPYRAEAARAEQAAIGIFSKP